MRDRPHKVNLELVAEIDNRQKALGWTRRDLAERSQVGLATVERLLVGNNCATFRTVSRIVLAINTQIAHINEIESSDGQEPSLQIIRIKNYYDLTETPPAPRPAIVDALCRIGQPFLDRFLEISNQTVAIGLACHVRYGKRFYESVATVMIACLVAYICGLAALHFGSAGIHGRDAVWIRFFQGVGCTAIYILRRGGRSAKLNATIATILITWMLLHFTIVGYYFGTCCAQSLLAIDPELGTGANAIATMIHSFLMCYTALLFRRFSMSFYRFARVMILNGIRRVGPIFSW